jgi:hypothetical protein
MRYKKCVTSLRGCQPTLEHLGKAWHQVLQGFDCSERCVELTYRIESPTADEVERRFGLSPRQESERIESAELGELADDVGDWHRLDNLTLSALQEEPYRRVLIQVGPGPDTAVEFEAVADDHWMMASYEKLVKDLALSQRFYKIGRDLSNALQSLPALLVALVWVVASVACALIAYGALVALVDPLYNVIHTLIQGKTPSDSRILALLWSFVVVLLICLAYSFHKSIKRSCVRRSRPPLFSAENANVLLNIGMLVAALIGIVISAAK